MGKHFNYHKNLKLAKSIPNIPNNLWDQIASNNDSEPINLCDSNCSEFKVNIQLHRSVNDGKCAISKKKVFSESTICIYGRGKESR
jgi:hypothetical protein